MADYTKPVVFKLGNESYGVDIGYVKGIEQQVSIVPVPNSLAFVKGIINLRGEVIPVFDLKKKFQMAEAGVSGNNLIVVSVGDMKLALEVDAVDEINDVDAENIVPMPAIIKQEGLLYLDRVANVNGKLIVLLDLDYLLSDVEKEKMKNRTEELQ